MFDAFEEHIKKAREAKGLDQWKKLESIAGKLAGKQAGDITFTCSHPSHAGEPAKHVLGSSTGNLHFLLGYGNPGFHLAEYHWLIIDPNLTDKDIKNKKNPTNIQYWKSSGLPVTEEGDVEEGEAHPGAAKALEQEAKQKTIAQEAVRAKNGFREYLGIPSMGLVFGLSNDQVYKWELVRNSYMAVTNPEFTQAMNDAMANTDPVEVVEKAVMPEFSEEVYPLVKALFPKPGTTIPVNDSVIGRIGADSVSFYTKDGVPTDVLIYDQVYKSLDLRKDGDIHPEIVVNFATDVLNIVVPTEIPDRVIKGHPTTGYESVDALAPEAPTSRSIVVVDGIIKALP